MFKVLLTVVIFTVIYINQNDAYPIDKLYVKITNNISKYFTKPQIKQISQFVTTNCVNGKGLTRILDDLQNFTMTRVATPVQKQEITALMKKMDTALGGTGKGSRLMDIIFEVFALDQIYFEGVYVSKCKKMKSDNEPRNKIIGTLVKFFADRITRDSVERIVNSIKGRFTQKECKVAFNNLVPKYLRLGLYGFMKTPCTGGGSSSPDNPPPPPPQ